MANWTDLFVSASGLSIIDAQVYSSNATWTKPAGAVLVRVVLCGGGGSGRRPAANAAVSSGGTAAPMVEMTFPAAGLGATESVVVGAGGAAQTVTATDGNDGGYSAFGKLEAAGGLKGFNSAFGPPFTLWHPSSLAPSTAATRAPANGVAPGSSSTSVGYDGAIGIIGGAGGFVGANNSSAGKAGGASNRYRDNGSFNSANATSGIGGTTGGATGGNGGAGANGEIRIGLGGEGGGSGGGGTTTGGAGGAGGVPGGGGGAGGFGTTTSGNSGAGGAGQVYVETWG